MNPARLIFPAVRWERREIDAVWPEVRDALELGVGGFIVFGGAVGQTRELVERAEAHAGRQLLFAADLERGSGQQFEDGTKLPPPAALAALGEAAIEEAARITAREALSAGVAWVFAPVADLDIEPRNPIVGTRSFGADPESVALSVRAWVQAAQEVGVHACAKHFPGHGRTTLDSHAELPRVSDSSAALEADTLPFRVAIAAGVRSIMLAHVAYLAFDPGGRPASLSPAIVGYLRDELAFDGLVVTDALIMEAISSSGPAEAEAAVEAIRAGCDALLYPSSPAETLAALESALRAGDLEGQRLDDALARVEAATMAPRKSSAVDWGSHADSAHKLATDSLLPLRGQPTSNVGEGRVRLFVIDDDAVVPAGARIPPTTAEQDRSHLADSLAACSIDVLERGSSPDAIDLIAVFSDVRGWKGRAGLAVESVAAISRTIDRHPDAIVVLFGHPRLAEALPHARHLLCAWCGSTRMQDAAVRYMFARS